MRTGAIAVDGVSRCFLVRAREVLTLKELLVARGRTGAQEVWALHDVTASVEPGEAVGLIGRNGSGKSTLLRLIAGIIRPTSGCVAAGGRVGSLLELGAGFHPDFTGRENVFLNGSIQGLRRAQIRERFDEMVAFAELEPAIDRPVRTYSSGMVMRLGFAIAAFLDADILLLDEVFAVGDESFQRKCFGVIAEFKSRGGTIVFVSHDASAVERLCERSLLLQQGRLVFDGPTRDAVGEYRRALASEPPPVEQGTRGQERATSPARIVAARLKAPDGAERSQFLAGEPIALEVDIERSEPVAAPRLHVELRDDAGLLVGEQEIDTGTLGWNGDAQLSVRLDLPDPALQFGRFDVRLGLWSDDDRRLLLHELNPALSLLVYPDGPERGLVRLEGTWSVASKDGRR
jgi:ABC-type polysaccharide/polyol phosphate transport system ATPase subunit